MKLETIVAVRANKTVYRDGDLAVKVFDSSFPKSDILNEALNHTRVEETGLKVPALMEVTRIEGNWAIVTEFIEGKTLQRLMDERPEMKKEYLDTFVDIQIRMHLKKCPRLNRLQDKMHRKIDQATLSPATQFELHARLDAMPRHDKLCHGDFNPSNIIITPEGEAFILDWSHATQGNASADAARTYLLFYLAGEIDLAEKYLQVFCEKSDTPLPYVQKWIPIVAASQSVKGRQVEREFLLHWVDVVEYE